jgi:hypothetical protein
VRSPALIGRDVLIVRSRRDAGIAIGLGTDHGGSDGQTARSSMVGETIREFRLTWRLIHFEAR